MNVTKNKITADEVLVKAESLFGNKKSAKALLDMCNSPNGSYADLSNIIEADPTLAALVLRLANSEYYGLRSLVSKIPLAVTMLGFSTIRALAISQIMDGVSGLGVVLWDVARLSAITGSIVAENFGGNSNDVSVSFTGALMHNIGQLLYYTFDTATYHAALRNAESMPYYDSLEFIGDFELTTYGASNQDLCARLMSNWGFPTKLVEASSSYNKSPKDIIGKAVNFGAMFANFIKFPSNDWADMRIPQELASLDMLELRKSVTESLVFM